MQGGSTDLAKDLTSSVVSSVGSMLEPVEVYANTSQVNVDGFVLEFNSSTGTITGYISGEGALNIPEKINGVTVNRIGDSAFTSSELTSINIPSSVTSIGEYPFGACLGLTFINVDSSNPKYTSQNGVLFSKDLKTIVTYPAGKKGTYTIPDSVTSIGNKAFLSCMELTSITIPNSVTSIGNSAFAGCSRLTSINIPSSVTSIGFNAFWICLELKDIYYSGSQSQWNAIDKSEAKIPEDARIHYNSTAPSYNNSSLPFGDVSSSANYYEALKYLVEKGIINGTSDTTFSPNDVMTRATLVVMLYRMEGSPATVPVTFTDVPEGSWYASAIAWAKNLGLVNGTGDGSTFSPDDALTKEQVVAIIDRYYTSKSYNLNTTKSGTISDSSKASSWALDSVNKMYKLGILNTDSSNNFNPTSKATRSDVAYMLGELLLKVNN